MALILQPYCNHYENTTFRVILKIVPPKNSEEKEPKKRTGEELAGMLSSKEKKIKKSLQKSLGMK